MTEDDFAWRPGDDAESEDKATTDALKQALDQRLQKAEAEIRAAMPEEEVFAFLCRKYVQRADERQKAMGLQYTTAETHGLAKQIASLLSTPIPLKPKVDEAVIGITRTTVGQRFANRAGYGDEDAEFEASVDADIAAHLPPKPKVDEDAGETGWLIEEPAKEGRGPKWLQTYMLEEPNGSPGFWLSPTSHAADALRFARERDAKAFLHNLQQLHPGVWDHCIVTDHSWSMTL